MFPFYVVRTFLVGCISLLGIRITLVTLIPCPIYIYMHVLLCLPQAPKHDCLYMGFCSGKICVKLCKCLCTMCMYISRLKLNRIRLVATRDLYMVVHFMQCRPVITLWMPSSIQNMQFRLWPTDYLFLNGMLCLCRAQRVRIILPWYMDVFYCVGGVCETSIWHIHFINHL